MKERIVSYLKRTIFIILGLVLFYYTIKKPTLGKITIGIIFFIIFLLAGLGTQNFDFNIITKETKWYVIAFRIIVAGLISLSLLGVLIYFFGRGDYKYEDINER